MEIFRNSLGFIGLDVTDEMPVEAVVAQGVYFLQGFLNVILSEVALSLFGEGKDFF